MNQNLTIKDIFIYPIKSLGGIRVEEAYVEEKGLQYDRRWMLVTPDGNFISQRKFPQLALLQVVLAQDALLVFDKRNRSKQIRIPFDSTTEKTIQVRVWDDSMDAELVGNEFDLWFSKMLGTEVLLVRMPEKTKRPVDRKYAKNGEIVSFADGMPYLIIGQSSLNDLNSKVSEKITMDRFRPNVVFSGGPAFFEDQMNFIKIGDIGFSVIKPCARCVMITVDQKSGEKGKEPLKTLAAYRSKNNKVLFGQNMVAMSFGKIQVGDPLLLMD